MRKSKKNDLIIFVLVGVRKNESPTLGFQNSKIEIGTFLKNRDPPPSVFKIPKLKLGHFWIVPNFLDFLF